MAVPPPPHRAFSSSPPGLDPQPAAKSKRIRVFLCLIILNSAAFRMGGNSSVIFSMEAEARRLRHVPRYRQHAWQRMSTRVRDNSGTREPPTRRNNTSRGVTTANRRSTLKGGMLDLSQTQESRRTALTSTLTANVPRSSAYCRGPPHSRGVQFTRLSDTIT